MTDVLGYPRFAGAGRRLGWVHQRPARGGHADRGARGARDPALGRRARRRPSRRRPRSTPTCGTPTLARGGRRRTALIQGTKPQTPPLTDSPILPWGSPPGSWRSSGPGATAAGRSSGASRRTCCSRISCCTGHGSHQRGLLALLGAPPRTLAAQRPDAGAGADGVRRVSQGDSASPALLGGIGVSQPPPRDADAAGGHFAALEEPEALAADIRAFFRGVPLTRVISRRGWLGSSADRWNRWMTGVGAGQGGIASYSITRSARSRMACGHAQVHGGRGAAVDHRLEDRREFDGQIRRARALQILSTKYATRAPCGAGAPGHTTAGARSRGSPTSRSHSGSGAAERMPPASAAAPTMSPSENRSAPRGVRRPRRPERVSEFGGIAGLVVGHREPSWAATSRDAANSRCSPGCSGLARNATRRQLRHHLLQKAHAFPGQWSTRAVRYRPRSGPGARRSFRRPASTGSPLWGDTGSGRRAARRGPVHSPPR